MGRLGASRRSSCRSLRRASLERASNVGMPDAPAVMITSGPVLHYGRTVGRRPCGCACASWCRNAGVLILAGTAFPSRAPPRSGPSVLRHAGEGRQLSSVGDHCRVEWRLGLDVGRDAVSARVVQTASDGPRSQNGQFVGGRVALVVAFLLDGPEAAGTVGCGNAGLTVNNLKKRARERPTFGIQHADGA
jgi:hypothetical protein